MICPHCGKENVDRSPFCAKCGQSLVGAPINNAAQTAPTPEQNTTAAQQVQQTQTPPTQQASFASQQPPTQQAPYTPPSQPVTPPQKTRTHYAKGCMSAAWDDIIHSEGWISKMLLLGLISLVPILNFVVIGYAIKWARELPQGQISQMSKQIFADHNFANGFYAFVFALVVGIVSAVACGILGWVPILGALAGAALAILLEIFAYLGYIRIGLTDRLGPAFDLPQIWDAYKKDFGALLCAGFLPSLIVGAIAFVITMILGFIFLIPIMGQLFTFADASYYYSSAAAQLSMILSLFGTIMPAFLLVYIVLCFASAVETVWVMRAMGHYVARYAPEWNELSAQRTTYYQV